VDNENANSNGSEWKTTEDEGGKEQVGRAKEVHKVRKGRAGRAAEGGGRAKNRKLRQRSRNGSGSSKLRISGEKCCAQLARLDPI
jgi:hypothetical protein